MGQVPTQLVQDAFLAPTAKLTRRLEIYEQDGETPWRSDLWSKMLIGGSVTIDYDRDERRNFDIEVDNSYGDLNPQAGGLWYDKVFKIFYGIRLDQRPRDVRVMIVEEYLAPGQADYLQQMLSEVGIQHVRYDPNVTTFEEVYDYDVLVSISSTSSQRTAFLTQMFNRGKSILQLNMQTTATQLPYLLSNTSTVSVPYTSDRVFTPNSLVHPIMTGWDTWSMKQSGMNAHRRILAPAAEAVIAANSNDTANGTSLAVVARENLGLSRWVLAQFTQFELAAYAGEGATQLTNYTNAANFLARAINWANMYEPLETWEAQIGEFLADGIQDTADLNDRLKIVGRDMAKKCLNSKFSKSTTFVKTQPIEEVIKAVASNAGITKLAVPTTGKALGKDMTWERDTSRWEVIKEVANANNYEVFFDAQGYLTMREFRDPLLTPPSLRLTTGEGGNLVSRGAKTSDSRLFNHIIVVGESSDSAVPPVYAEAVNDTPGSSSSRAEIGDRVQVITSALVADANQAKTLANSTLAVSALEEFELDFVCTLLPWVETGDIMEMEQSNDRYWGPDRYLISNLTLPLDLTPMSGNGKRVAKVT